METLGDQNLVELYGCDPKILSNRDSVKSIILEGGKIIKVTPIFDRFEKTAEGGVSGAEVIAESHISAHTIPAIRCVELDVYTCGKGLNIEDGIRFYYEAFGAKHFDRVYLARGFLPAPGEDILNNVNQRELRDRLGSIKKGVLSEHIIADFYQCNPMSISYENTVAPVLLQAAMIADPEGFSNDKISVNQFHNFPLHGVSGIIIAPKKHATEHSWPEHRLITLDLLLNADNDNWAEAILYLKKAFDSKDVIIMHFERGNPDYLKY